MVVQAAVRVPYTLPEQDDSACLRPKDFISPREASAAWKLEHKPPLHDVSAVVTPMYEIENHQSDFKVG